MHTALSTSTHGAMIFVSPQSSTRSWRPPPAWSDPVFDGLEGLAADVVRGELSQCGAVFALEAITLKASARPVDPEIRAVFHIALHVFWQRLRDAITQEAVRKYRFEQVLKSDEVYRASRDGRVADAALGLLVRSKSGGGASR